MFDTVLRRSERLAEVQAQRALLRFLNGVEWLIRDPRAVVGRTPYDVVYRRQKLELRRYRRSRARNAPRFDLPGSGDPHPGGRRLSSCFRPAYADRHRVCRERVTS